MAKAQHHRSGSRGTPTRRKASARATGGRQPGALLRNAPLTLAGLVVVGLALWWGVSSVTNSGADSTGSVRPIANLDAPDVHSLLVDPQNPEHVLFGSHAGIQESRDGGFSWVNGGLRDADAMQLAASPKAPETLYATGHDVFQVSRDGGQTWQPLAHNLPGTDIHGFAQNPADPNRLYAFVAGAGTFTSPDAGTTWTPLPTQPPGGGMHLALASSGAALYAATEAGIVASSDHGVTWTPLRTQPNGQAMSLAIPASDPQTIYVGTPHGLAKSTDAGASWTGLGPDDVPVLALAVAPTDPQRVLFVSEGAAVYRSDDGGTTWTTPR